MADSERQPLIVNSPVPPPAYTTDSLGPNEVIVLSIDADELPPPYTPSTHGGIPMINCKVCQSMINLEGKTNQHVVKCNICNEATPIRPAPAGKKYVRCKCNCLLICKAGSRRVACPRENCKKIILLGLPVADAPHSQGNMRVCCAHCQETFLFNIQHLALARCPHCRKVSSIGRSFARNRFLRFFLPGLVIIVIGIIVTVLTHHHALNNGGFYALYVIVFVVSLLLLLRAAYYCTIKVSSVEGPA